jgi:hypothetical protein
LLDGANAIVSNKFAVCHDDYLIDYIKRRSFNL